MSLINIDENMPIVTTQPTGGSTSNSSQASGYGSILTPSNAGVSELPFTSNSEEILFWHRVKLAEAELSAYSDHDYCEQFHCHEGDAFLAVEENEMVDISLANLDILVTQIESQSFGRMMINREDLREDLKITFFNQDIAVNKGTLRRPVEWIVEKYGSVRESDYSSDDDVVYLPPPRRKRSRFYSNTDSESSHDEWLPEMIANKRRYLI